MTSPFRTLKYQNHIQIQYLLFCFFLAVAFLQTFKCVQHLCLAFAFFLCENYAFVTTTKKQYMYTVYTIMQLLLINKVCTLCFHIHIFKHCSMNYMQLCLHYKYLVCIYVDALLHPIVIRMSVRPSVRSPGSSAQYIENLFIFIYKYF